ncbi:unnamed protein product [Spirodela intermedia]|uniref:non-specific serine/threonine protein kinase n=1 Tax=Spirodela intermedia TaxID=51605 RepID=A0A7I8IRU2_SPIIN|nr:unnamed protein product [Spirodela intermedia]CAA6660574.1 unnamed protein product [Spirodela intermedia]
MGYRGDRHFPFLLLSSLIFFLQVVVFKSYAADLALGSVLRPSDFSSPWVSPRKTFSLGFFAVDPTNTSLYVVAIALTGGVRIWTAGGRSPLAAVDSAGYLHLQPDGNLRLVDGSGATVWETGTAGRGVTAAGLRDSGNFELRNGSSVVWDSFSQPTDTIVQTQNFSSGWWNDTIVYYNEGPNTTSHMSNTSITSPGLRLEINGIVSLSDPSFSQPSNIAYSSDFGDNNDLFRYLRLDDDGNLRAYSYMLASRQETARWSAVTDQCEVFGWCGNMGICSYNDTEPSCGCPSQNFELVDPGDPRGGCKRRQELRDCPGAEVFFVGIAACEQNCLSGASCGAATSLADGTGLCYLKVSNFLSGYQSRALPSTSFVKVCGPGVYNQPPPPADQPQKGSSNLSAWIIVVVVAGTISGLILLETALWWCFCRNSRRYGPSGRTTRCRSTPPARRCSSPTRSSTVRRKASKRSSEKAASAPFTGACWPTGWSSP